MRLIIWLTVLTYGSLALLGIVIVLFAVTFTRGQRTRYPLLRRLDGKQIHLTVAAILLTVVAYSAYTARDILVVTRSVESIDLGERTRNKATSVAFNSELSVAGRRAVDRAATHFAAGDRLAVDGRFADAAREYELSADSLPTKSAFLNLALMRGIAADVKRSRDAVLAGLALPSNHETSRLDANLWLELGRVAPGLGRQDEAHAALDRATQIFTTEKDRKGLAEVSIARAALLSISAPQLSEAEASKALALYRQIGDREGEASALLNIANARYARGDIEQAVPTLARALTIFRETKKIVGQIECLSLMGGAYNLLGDNRRAEARLTEAMELARRHGFGPTEVNMALNLAHIQIDLGESEKAVATATEALRAVQGDPSQKDLQGVGMLVRAYARTQLGEAAQAVDECREAIRLLQEAKIPIMVADGRATLSSICLQAGDVACAETEARAALKMSHELKSPPIELESRAALAGVLEKKNDTAGAVREADIAVKICSELHAEGNMNCKQAIEIQSRLRGVKP